MKSSSLMWFMGLPLLHGIAVSYLFPNAGLVSLMLILDVSIVCGYGARRAMVGGPPTVVMMLAFNVPGSYLGGVLTYFTSMGFWFTDSVVAKAVCLFGAFFGVYSWVKFPMRWLGVIRG